MNSSPSERNSNHDEPKILQFDLAPHVSGKSVPLTEWTCPECGEVQFIDGVVFDFREKCEACGKHFRITTEE